MQEFNFGRGVRINGEDFYFLADVDELGAIFSRGQKKMSELEKDTGMSSIQKLKKIKESAIETLNAIFGDGAFENIYGKRAFTIPDYINLLGVIRAEIEDINTETRGGITAVN